MTKTLSIVATFVFLSPPAVGAQEPLTADADCQNPSARAGADQVRSLQRTEIVPAAVRYEIVDGAVYVVFDGTNLRLPLSGGGATGCLPTAPAPTALSAGAVTLRSAGDELKRARQIDAHGP